MAKKALCLVFAFLLSINSFAAVVSDNDGSSFITKAEFDSLKNNFQMQLDSYNANIDSKIDNAIAGYLAGIKVETTEELTSYLNKINDMSSDFYLDGGGNKIRYGYRCMARQALLPTTQTPIGAIVNLLIGKFDVCMNNASTSWSYSSVGAVMARFGLNFTSRTSYSDVNIPSNRRQGKYLMINYDNNGNYYPAHYGADFEYRYFVGGSSFTYTGESGLRSASADGYGTWSHDEIKNDDDFWSIKTANVGWVWNDQNSSMQYDQWKVAYGGTFRETDTWQTFPICAVANDDVICLREDKVPSMTTEKNTSYDWNLWLGRGYNMRSYPNLNDWVLTQWAGHGDNDPDPDHSPSADPNQDTSITFYFNHHPWQQMNTKDLIDNDATIVLGKKVKITDGLPVFKASFDGVVDMKMQFKRTIGHRYAFGLSKSPLQNTYYSMLIDSDLNFRDFNDVKYTTNTFNVDELEMRLDVKKNDVIYFKAIDVEDNYAFVGAKTTQIKLTSDKNR